MSYIKNLREKKSKPDESKLNSELLISQNIETWTHSVREFFEHPKFCGKDCFINLKKESFGSSQEECSKMRDLVFKTLCSNKSSIFNAFIFKPFDTKHFSVSLRLKKEDSVVGNVSKEYLKKIYSNLETLKMKNFYENNKELHIKNLKLKYEDLLVKKFESIFLGWKQESKYKPFFLYKFFDNIITCDGKYISSNIIISLCKIICGEDEKLNCLKWYLNPKKDGESFSIVTFTLKDEISVSEEDSEDLVIPSSESSESELDTSFIEEKSNEEEEDVNENEIDSDEIDIVS